MPTVTAQQAVELALEHHRAGRLAEAEAVYREVLAVEPNHADALHLLGVLAAQKGRHDLAVDWIGRSLGVNPANAAALGNLGEAYRATGRLDEALVAYRRALELEPQAPRAHRGLAAALVAKGRLEEAEQAYRRWLVLDGNSAEAWNQLGWTLMGLHRWEDAENACRRAIGLQPDFAEALGNLGNVLRARGRSGEAEAMCRRALEINPRLPEVSNNLGVALAEQGRFEEAIATYREALGQRPDFSEAQNNLGIALGELGRLDEAVDAFRESLRLKADDPEVENNLGIALGKQGLHAEAIGAYRRALATQPDYAAVRSNLICTLHRHPEENEAAAADEERIWNQRFFEPLKRAVMPHGNLPDPGRRLRIGYVSPDFRFHPIGFFLAPLLEAHDRARHEIYCYADVRRPDEVTARLGGAVDRWRDARGFTDAQLAECIRADGVDILVDLAMHMAGNRLPAFARRPAPVQVSWLAYPGSTGLEAMDYRLTDEWLDPVGKEQAGAGGEMVRLPDSWCCYVPIVDFPEVGELPAALHGGVTFGSFNQFDKIDERLLRLWARLLGNLPAARLVMICPQGRARERTEAVFAASGIAGDRIEFVPVCAWASYVRLFERIDIALDTYPCNGMTTTCHALWMGVPVVTLAGRSAVSRAGCSLLHTAGFPGWVAESEEDYLRIAAELAGDLRQLAEVRRTLRLRMQESPLMDAPRFARHVETAYRTMWERWCAGVRP